MMNRLTRWIALAAAVLLGVVLPMMAVPGGALAAPTHRPAAKAHTFFTCVWQGQTIRIKHIKNNPVERYRDAVVAGRCTNFQTNDRYYGRLVGKSINTFVAWREYPGLYVVHNSLQGHQPVYGDWTFAIGITHPGTLQGVVSDSSTQQPIAGVTVTASKCSGSPQQCVIHTSVTDSGGRYQMQIFQAGTYSVTEALDGYAASSTTKVKIQNGRSYTKNFTLTKQATPTTIALTASPATVTANAQVTLSAAVSKPVSDGTITFTGTGPNGATFTSQTCTPVAGACSVTWTPSAAGAWTIMAAYSGDATYAASSTSATLTVVALSTSLTLSAASVSVAAGTADTITALLGASVSGGTVTFTATGPNGATATIASCTPANGTCSSPFTATAAGTWSITASWSGAAGYGQTNASAPVSVTVTPSAPTLTITPGTPANGSVPLTATFNPAVSDGTVTFSFAGPNGATSASQTCAPSGGTCTVNWAPSTTGSWTITVRWSGDAQYPPVQQTIQVQVQGSTGSTPTTITLTSSPSQPGVNTATTITARISPAVNGGTVSFAGVGPNSATFTSQTCAPISGVCTITWTPTAAGTWTISGVYSGDSTYSSSSTTLLVTVGTTGTNVTISANPAASAPGHPIALTGTLSNTSLSGGTLTFTESSTTTGIGSATQSCAPTNGSCSVYWNPTTPAVYTITATYTGTTSNNNGTGSTTYTVSQPGTLSLTANTFPIGVNQQETIQATLNGGNIGGTVTFTVTGPNGVQTSSSPGTCSPAPTCTVTFTPNAAGTWTIQGFWTGTNGQTASDTLNLPVGSNSTALTLQANPSSPAVNQATTITATLGAGATGGTITFTATGPSGATTAPFNTTVCVPSSGTCSVTFTPNVQGTWTVTAGYGGNGTFGPTSSSITIQVGTGTVNMTFSPSPAVVNQTDTVTATLPVATDNGGTITFTFTATSSGVQPITTSCTVVNGTCSAQWVPSAAGTWSVSATWSGGNAASLQGTAQVTVSSSGTTTSETLTVSAPSTGAVNTPVSITVQLSPATSDGSVQVIETDTNGDTDGQGPTQISSNGTATFSWSPQVAGQYEIIGIWYSSDGTSEADNYSNPALINVT